MAADFLGKFKKQISSLKDNLPFKKHNIESDVESEDKTGQFKVSDELLSDATNPQYKETPSENELLDSEDITSSISEEEQELDDEELDVDDEDEEDEDEDKIEKDKKRKKIVYAIVVLALLYMVYDETTKTQEPAPQEVVAQNRPVVERKKKNEIKEDKPEEVINNVAVETPEVVEVVEVQEEPVKVIEEQAVVNEALPEEVQTEEISPQVDESTSVEEIVNEEKTSEEIANVEEIVDNTDQENQQKANSIGQQDEQSSDDIVSNESDLNKQLSEIVKTVENESRENQIKLEYIAPPNYENFGESLVYNCKGKHWACVDKKSHFECLGNYNWAKQNNKVPECSNSKVLASPSDCRKLQLYNINMLGQIPDCE